MQICFYMLTKHADMYMQGLTGPGVFQPEIPSFLVCRGGGNGKSDDLALNASLGDFMSLHESEMKAIESKWSKAERPLKKPKGPSRTTSCPRDCPLGREGGGQSCR